MVSYGTGFLPLFEDVVGGVLVGGVGGDTFEQISGLFAQANGLFAVGIPDDPVVVNVGNGNGTNLLGIKRRRIGLVFG